MADTFLNNQEVTAEDLNNIAIDLGYADYSHFPETPPQSAVSALNQITYDLTSEGILQIGNKCTVSITDNKIVIQDGVCVFANGAKKRIEGTMSIDFIEGGTNYVYFLNNVAGNQIQLINSLTLPTSGDFVTLAEISADKVVKDMRTPSRAKFGTNGANVVMPFSVTVAKGVTTKVYEEGDLLLSLDVPSEYSRVVFNFRTQYNSGRWQTAILRISDLIFEVQSNGSGDAYHNQSYWMFPHKCNVERVGGVDGDTLVNRLNFIARETLYVVTEQVWSGYFI